MKLKIVLLIKIISILILVPLVLMGALFIYTLFKVDEIKQGYDWDETLEFSLYYTTVLEFDESMNILLMTDLHFKNVFDFLTIELMDKVVELTHPDLIILVGDNTFTPFNGEALNLLIKTMDAYKVPWTLVYGNHDDNGRHTKNYMSNQLLHTNHSIFSFGPNDFSGSGNQIILFKTNETFVHAFYLLDTVSTGEISPKITEHQESFYRWAVLGLESLTQESIISSLITHVPLPEMVLARMESNPLFGNNQEASSVNMETTIFDTLLNLGSTKYTFHGHDHVNNASYLYQGIQMTYVTQVGMTTYGDRSKKGGTLLILNQDGTLEISHILV